MDKKINVFFEGKSSLYDIIDNLIFESLKERVEID